MLPDNGVLDIHWHGLHLRLALDPAAPAKLLHLGADGHAPAEVPAAAAWAHRLVEVTVGGEDHDYIAAGRHNGSGLAARLQTTGHRDAATAQGRQLSIEQRDALTGLVVVSHLLLAAGLPVLRSWTELRHDGDAPLTVTAVSSFFLAGPAAAPRGPQRVQPMQLWRAANSWYSECQWQRQPLVGLGMANNFAFGSRFVGEQSVGSWSTAQALPMGFLERLDDGALVGPGLLWEIESAGSWSWQVADSADTLTLHLSGATESAGQWWRHLQPGDRLASVAAVVVPSSAGFEPAMAALTRWRRQRCQADLRAQPVVFNDYMNCLMGDPTQDKVLPLIDAAAALGADVYCMDAGWYASPGVRWSHVLGHWAANPQRFPQGLRPVMDRIRERGMVPGLWFEIEVMTSNHPDYARWPDSWFHTRHGRRTLAHRRALLDFRVTEVREFADQSIDRAVLEFGVGFLKLDCNVGSGPGPEREADSPGAGLREHEDAWLAWLDGVRSRHPQLLLEHCASGGMRLSQPYLSRVGVASNSDQGQALHVARIAAASPSALLPEQSGTWALPRCDDTPEQVAFAMLGGLLLRLSLAGDSAQLAPEGRALVQEAVALHKTLRAEVGAATPFWPLGLPEWDDPWLALGLRTPQRLLLAVWRRHGGPATVHLPLNVPLGRVTVLYPRLFATEWQSADSTLLLSLPEQAGRLLAVELTAGKGVAA